MTRVCSQLILKSVCREYGFKNRFGVELAGHLYLPQNFDASKKYAAIAVCGPFGAVKESGIRVVCARDGSSWVCNSGV